MLVFDERGKREHPEKNLSVQGRGPTTITLSPGIEPGHIGGRQVLSPSAAPSLLSKLHLILFHMIFNTV